MYIINCYNKYLINYVSFIEDRFNVNATYHQNFKKKNNQLKYFAKRNLHGIVLIKTLEISNGRIALKA